MNKLPLIPKKCLIEQSFVIILDPTSILFKNVTPYCIRFSEIQFYFKNRLLVLEEISQLVFDQVFNLDLDIGDEIIEEEFHKQVKVKLGDNGNLISKLFQIQEFQDDCN